MRVDRLTGCQTCLERQADGARRTLPTRRAAACMARQTPLKADHTLLQAPPRAVAGRAAVRVRLGTQPMLARTVAHYSHRGGAQSGWGQLSKMDMSTRVGSGGGVWACGDRLLFISPTAAPL